jgi:hypothetical protein
VQDLGMLDQDNNPCYKDPLEIYQTILETLKKSSTMTVQEDYPAWKAANFKSSMGKLLLIDQADYLTQHIFFDDNADDYDDCIVDVRDVVTGKQISFDKYIDMYVVKVHPTRAILEMDYFIKMIENAESKRDEEIQRVEAGIEDEEQQSTN